MRHSNRNISYTLTAAIHKPLTSNEIATSPEILAEAERVGLTGYIDRLCLKATPAVRFPTDQPKAEGSSRYEAGIAEMLTGGGTVQ